MTIELPARPDQTAFNLRRWSEMLVDPEVAKLPGRVETDRHGHVIMSPPAAIWHSNLQSRINQQIATLLPDGRSLTECAISTADGVRSADVAWISELRYAQMNKEGCMTEAPEICVEIISRGNTRAEMKEKRALYFDAGAAEVWFCDRDGRMTFFYDDTSAGENASRLCPQFPPRIDA